MTYEEKLEAAGHVLERYEDGRIDVFAYSEFHCNGPKCTQCDDVWCHHCAPSISPCPGREATDAADKAARYAQYLKLKEEFESNGISN